MTKRLAGTCAALLLITGAGCVSPAGPPLSVVDDVVLERYAGLWYEIARYPNGFQDEECVGVTAEYTLRDDGRINVVNRCRQGALDGPVESITGVARVPNPDEPAKLKVQFFWPFEGDYWIIQLDPDYQWAVVGEPSRRTLWILSRTPTLPDDTYNAIVARLPEQGYDPTQLRQTPQPPGGVVD